MEYSFFVIWVFVMALQAPIGPYSSLYVGIAYYFMPLYGIVTIVLRLPFRNTGFYDNRITKSVMNAGVHAIYGAFIFWYSTGNLPFLALGGSSLPIIMQAHLDWAWLTVIFFNFGAAYYVYRPISVAKLKPISDKEKQGKPSSCLRFADSSSCKFDMTKMASPNWLVGKWILLRFMEFIALVIVFWWISEKKLDDIYTGIIIYFFYVMNPLYLAASLFLRAPFRIVNTTSYRIIKATANSVVHAIYGVLIFISYSPLLVWVKYSGLNSDIVWLWFLGIFFNFATAYYVYRPSSMPCIQGRNL